MSPRRRADVVHAALALLDEVGLDAMTTRRLAQRLGVQVGALYRHVASKRELLVAVAEQIVQQALAPPLPAGDWAAQVSGFAHRLRRALLAHRDGARVVAEYGPLGPNTLHYAELGIALLRDAGMPLAPAAHGGHTIVSFVIGFVLQEQAPPADPDGHRAALVRQTLPNLAEWLSQRPDEDAAFAIGLGMVVNGLRAELAEGHSRTGAQGACERGRHNEQ